MLDPGADLWEIALRTVVVYAAILGGLRLTGKRQIGQMAPFDLVVILLIANAVQNAMVGPDTSLLGGLVAGAVLLIANFVVSRLNESLPIFRKVAEGAPVVLVSEGQPVMASLRHEGIDLEELEQAIREHSVAGLDDVELAVLEVDGSISVIPKNDGTVRSRRRFRQLRHQ